MKSSTLDYLPNGSEAELPPHDREAEAGALACILNFENGEAEIALSQLHLDQFYEEQHKQIFRALESLRLDRKPLNVVTLATWLRDKGEQENAGGFDYIQRLPDATPSPANFPSFLETLQDRTKRRAVLNDASEISQLARNPAIGPGVLTDAMRRMIEAHGATTAGTELLEKFKARLFDASKAPERPEPRFYLGDVPISTPGNITALAAPGKHAKSSFLAAMLGATEAEDGCDCLTVRASNPNGLAVIHFDTEQSQDHHWDLMKTAMRRARLEIQPAWWVSAYLTGFSVSELRQLIPLTMEHYAKQFGGIHSVFLDGSADFVKDVNDAEESNGLVSELHGLAIQYLCPIVGVIHFNPGSEKTRGHLGSQLERKAETNLKMERDGEAIIVWGDKNRRAPILKDRGPRFVWSDEHKMHVTVESARDAKLDAKRADMILHAKEVFEAAGKSCLRWGAVIENYAQTVLRNKKSESTARKHIEEMIRARVLTKNIVGLYELGK